MSTEISKTTPKINKQRSSFNIMKPLLLALFATAILLTGVIATVFGHKFGYHRGYNASQEEAKLKIDAQQMTSDEVKEMQQQVENLNKQLESTRKERDISLNNLGQRRREIQDLELQNLQLTQVNEVFKNSLIKKGGLPLGVIGAKMAPLPENAFEYRFDVAMVATDGRPHSLTPQLTLLDEKSLVEVPLEPKTYNIEGVTRIRGRFVMPEGFSPKQAKLNLRSNGQNFEQIYNWELLNPVDQMPMSLSEVPQTDQRPITAAEK